MALSPRGRIPGHETVIAPKNAREEAAVPGEASRKAVLFEVCLTAVRAFGALQ